jgi:HD superfamily phosphodiesterase
MKIKNMVNLINHAFAYVIKTSKIYNIDESHALKHSMDVYNYAHKIYESEVVKNPYLERQKEIIYTSAILHDMCDKKYMQEKNGISLIKTHMQDHISYTNLETVGNIISTMSYSKVKTNGYPNLCEHQLAYHIVREADLLSAYDFNRCIIYKMYKEKAPYDVALKDAVDLFNKRILKYRSDKLFITKYSKKESLKLHNNAKKELEIFEKTLIL